MATAKIARYSIHIENDLSSDPEAGPSKTTMSASESGPTYHRLRPYFHRQSRTRLFELSFECEHPTDGYVGYTPADIGNDRNPVREGDARPSAQPDLRPHQQSDQDTDPQPGPDQESDPVADPALSQASWHGKLRVEKGATRRSAIPKSRGLVARTVAAATDSNINCRVTVLQHWDSKEMRWISAAGDAEQVGDCTLTFKLKK